MRIGLIWRATAVAVAAGALGLAAGRLTWAPGIPAWSPVSIVVSGLLILLAVPPWWCVLLVLGMMRRAPEVSGLHDQLERFTLTGAASTALALVALNYLLGSLLPRGGAFVLLAAGVLGISGSCVLWLVRYYRRRS